MKICATSGIKTEYIEANPGDNLLDLLRGHGFYVPAACGGKGACGKCRVRVTDGSFDGDVCDENGFVLSCKSFVREDAAVEIPEVRGGGLDRSFAVRALGGDGTGYVAACDIGTTTLAAELVDASTGSVLGRMSKLNPQGAYGADVISRIVACGEGALGEMRDCVQAAVRGMLGELADAANVSVDVLTVAGNTTMQHLFLGVDPTSIGRYPFTPVFTEERVFSGSELGMRADSVRVMPSASGYFGADAVAGVYAVGMDGGSRTRLFVDIGTNGEIALRVGDRLMCASTAAGPALEGACIECGVGGIAGAIDRVRCEDGRLVFHTVGDAPAVGICGCGLVDLIAELLRSGVIDESGLLAEDSPYANARVEDDKIMLTDSIWLSQQDVRQFQLAKSAVHAGIAALCDAAGVAPGDVDEVLIAGGLGYYLDIPHTLATGILPRAFAGKVRVVGNTSLHGAALAAVSESARNQIARIAADCRIVELNESPVFADAYMMGMMFDTEDDV